MNIDFELLTPYLDKILMCETKCVRCNNELTIDSVYFNENSMTPFIFENGYICKECANKIPHCDNCHFICEQNDLVFIEDINKHYCHVCANEHAYVCFNCNKFYSNRRSYIQLHGNVCYDCYLTLDHFVCCNCDGEFLSDRYGTDDLCITCANEKVSNCLNYTFKPCPNFYKTKEEEKNDNLLFLGIELECGCSPTYHNVINFITKNANSFYYMKRDASIPAYGCEVVTHPATLDYHLNKAEWKNLLDSAKSYKLDSDNDRCGIHIHMSRIFFDCKDIYNIDYLVNNFSDFWKKIARRESHYSAYVSKNAREWGRQTTDRHCALNLSNPYTIELRIFKGTLDINILFAYMEITNCLANFVKTIDNINQKDIIEKFCNYCKNQKTKYLNEYLDKVLK